MSNLNDTFEQLQVFLRSLREFNEAIRLSAAELAESDEQITALWEDDAAVRYRGVYEPLAESLRSYLAVDAYPVRTFHRDEGHAVRRLSARGVGDDGH